MDLVTIGYVILVALGIIGVDTVIHADSVVVEVHAPSQVGSTQIDQPMIAGLVDSELRRLASPRSLVADPEIVMGDQKSVAMALADVANVRPVAVALQSQLGYQPTGLRFDVFTEGGTPQVMVSGRAPGHLGDFEELVVQRKGETVPDMIRRAVLIAMSRLDPYTTTLYLLDSYATNPDAAGAERLKAAESLAQHANAMLPPATVSPRRSLFNNILGTIALFHNQLDDARRLFVEAIESDPTSVIPVLNLTFLDLKLHNYGVAQQRMATLLTKQKPVNPVLLTIAYQMQGFANAGLGDYQQANTSFALAVQTMPDRPSTYEYWSKVKRKYGDIAEADALQARSAERRGKYTNYGEIATNYFSLGEEGENGNPLVRTKFAVAPVVSFR